MHRGPIRPRSEGGARESAWREREAKVLALTTERVRSQQEILRLKIAALQQQIDAIDAAEAAAEPIR